ncbi:hypothetical protein BH20GEM1_BH20GEM1_18880 [soil metagenome]
MTFDTMRVVARLKACPAWFGQPALDAHFVRRYSLVG